MNVSPFNVLAKTTKIIAIIWWVVILLSMFPYTFLQSGLFGEPAKPREISEATFTAPYYQFKALAQGIGILLLVVISVTPKKFFRKNRLLFGMSVGMASLVFLWVSLTIGQIFVKTYILSEGHDCKSFFLALAIAVIWLTPWLSLPFSLIINDMLLKRKTRSDGMQAPTN